MTLSTLLPSDSDEPKAALVSMEDYTRLRQEAKGVGQEQGLDWEEWLGQTQQLREEILVYLMMVSTWR